MIMITQLKAIIGFVEPEIEALPSSGGVAEEESSESSDKLDKQEDVLKTRIEDVDFSARTLRALSEASIRTIGGLARKKEEDLSKIAGLGDKGISEIKRALGNYGITLK